MDLNYNNEIRDGPHNYTALGPSESNDNIVQGAAEEPVAEGAISRPKSQASMHSNEVSSKPTHGMLTRVHPSILDHSYDSCYWETSQQGLKKVDTMRHHFIGSMQGGRTIICQIANCLVKGLQETECSRTPKPKLAQPTSHLPNPTQWLVNSC